jgi:DMSO/TMAO reductase YedYZ molybdopterin-dependent catalytic subunit
MRTRTVALETEPFNAETPLEVLRRRDITPNDSFYVRNHFTAPRIDVKTWKLSVTGAVKNALTLSLNEIMSMPRKTILATLECAGNGRTRMQPVPASTPWGDGAVGTARWTGATLEEILKKTQPLDNALDILFRGTDRGIEAGSKLSFERSILLTDALHEDTILAYEMNGRSLPRLHGFPLRLVVPGRYGMASVKWLAEIRVLSEPFQGYYQSDQYVYANSRNMADSPVNEIRVKSLILEPSENGVLKSRKSSNVSGLAWSGLGRITKVEFKTHNSEWKPAQLSKVDFGSYAWRRWSITWTPKVPGRYVLMSRASDDSGGQQPVEPVWNLRGYGYNTVTLRTVRVI